MVDYIAWIVDLLKLPIFATLNIGNGKVMMEILQTGGDKLCVKGKMVRVNQQ